MMECILSKVILLVILVKSILIHGTEFSVYTPDNRDYIMLSELSQYISDRIISFKVQTCTNAYVGLISGNKETDPLYEIAIGTYQNRRSFIRISKDYSAPKFSENAGPVLDCSVYTEFCITWDENTISVRRGLDVSGSLFLSWTSGTGLWPILNVGICTQKYSSTGNWIFFVQELTTIEPTNDISTTQLTLGDIATPESQSTDLHVSVDSTSLLKANSSGNLQTNITAIQYNNEESTTKADLNQTKLTTIEPSNDISTVQLTTGDTATPKSQSTDLYVSVDSTSLQRVNSTGNLQTNITTVQYNSEEATTKADRNQTNLTTFESTTDIPTTQLNIATSESKSTDRQALFASTSLPQATSTEHLQMNKTTIPHTNKDVTTRADNNQASNLTLKKNDNPIPPMDKTKCSQSQRCVCQKRISNSTENQDVYITKVTDYIWLKKCVLQPLIDSGVVKVSECPYQCNCSPKGDTTTQEYDMFACLRRP